MALLIIGLFPDIVIRFFIHFNAGHWEDELQFIAENSLR
uniref:Uncharacterized protein n=1 Tax=Anguilla anguilla TaxID=7936 RepID=A0A0E9R5X3_ANGAN